MVRAGGLEMRGGAPRTGPAPDSLALSVHGPSGVVDVAVPAGATVSDVAEEYARQAGSAVPDLYDRLGSRLTSEAPLLDAGVRTGAVLVALPAGTAAAAQRRERRTPVAVTESGRPGPLSALWCAVSGATALLAGWFAATAATGTTYRVAVGLLGGAAALGVLPLGRLAPHRAQVAPAFAAAAVLAVVWSPVPERLPSVLGLCALAGAVTAAVARALDRRSEEALRVWVLVGLFLFAATGLAALVGVAAKVVWSLLLVTAMLAARFVPMLAVDVPDQYLIDIERLAVTAWSARERPRGRRGRIVVPPEAVAEVAQRGTRLVTAAAAAILVVIAVAAPMLLLTARLPLDWIGARCLVGFAGAALLLAARSYRHAAARVMLRLAGLVCLAALSVALVLDFPREVPRLLGIGGVLLGAVLVAVGVAAGRGWRSAWWARRAEVAEGLCGAFALASVVVAVGLFRRLWEMTG